ncbi:hypothetical protein CLOP_g6997 [Closterium sp. NIES-67]|nr:hypothetical protein CLOP_g6997 [Closterium sp. NIES-67]
MAFSDLCGSKVAPNSDSDSATPAAPAISATASATCATPTATSSFAKANRPHLPPSLNETRPLKRSSSSRRTCARTSSGLFPSGFVAPKGFSPAAPSDDGMGDAAAAAFPAFPAHRAPEAAWLFGFTDLDSPALPSPPVRFDVGTILPFPVTTAGSNSSLAFRSPVCQCGGDSATCCCCAASPPASARDDCACGGNAPPSFSAASDAASSGAECGDSAVTPPLTPTSASTQDISPFPHSKALYSSTAAPDSVPLLPPSAAAKVVSVSPQRPAYIRSSDIVTTSNCRRVVGFSAPSSGGNRS